jgi:hypothetical protein
MTHIHRVPIFINKESSDSLIPNEDEDFCKNLNIVNLKFHSAFYPQTKAKVGRKNKINKSSSKVIQTTSTYRPKYSRNALSHVSNDSKSQSKCSSKSIHSIQYQKRSVVNSNLKKQFLGIIGKFKVCEHFLGFLSMADLINFRNAMRVQIRSSEFRFLVKKRIDFLLSQVYNSRGKV